MTLSGFRRKCEAVSVGATSYLPTDEDVLPQIAIIKATFIAASRIYIKLSNHTKSCKA